MISRIESLEECLKLWTWLSENHKYKQDWPGWEEYIAKYGIERHSCPCCHYCFGDDGINESGKNCEACPLNGFAWNVYDSLKGVNHGYFCEYSRSSIYENWKSVTQSCKTDFAKDMVDAIKSAIEAYNRKQNGSKKDVKGS